MQFLMLVCIDRTPGKANSDPGLDIEDWVEQNDKLGTRIIGDRIRPDAEATVVRVRGDEVLVTDGPFVETKEIVAGFDVLEARDLEHAIEIAAAHPMAREGGALELRAFWGDE